MPPQTSQRTFYLIDQPTPFAPIEEWRAFLAKLEAMPDKTDQIAESIRMAKAHIAATVEQ